MRLALQILAITIAAITICIAASLYSEWLGIGCSVVILLYAIWSTRNDWRES